MRALYLKKKAIPEAPLEESPDRTVSPAAPNQADTGMAEVDDMLKSRRAKNKIIQMGMIERASMRRS